MQRATSTHEAKESPERVCALSRFTVMQCEAKMAQKEICKLIGNKSVMEMVQVRERPECKLLVEHHC